MQVLGPQAVEAEVLGGGEGRFRLAFELYAQHHDDVGAVNRFAHVGGEDDAGREVGILADEIVGVRRLREVDLQPAGPALAGGAAGRVRGLGPERLVVLDAAAVLNDAGLVVNEEAGG